MSEDISNPLLSLVKEQGLIDDLQYEEVLGEFKRTGKPVSQILQDFGILDLDTHPAGRSPNQLGAPVVTLRERDLTPELLQTDPGQDGAHVSMPAGGPGRFHAAGRPGRPAQSRPHRRARLRRQEGHPTGRGRPGAGPEGHREVLPRGERERLPTSSKSWARTRRSPRKSARRRSPTTRR